MPPHRRGANPLSTDGGLASTNGGIAGTISWIDRIRSERLSEAEVLGMLRERGVANIGHIRPIVPPERTRLTRGKTDLGDGGMMGMMGTARADDGTGSCLEAWRGRCVRRSEGEAVNELLETAQDTTNAVESIQAPTTRKVGYLALRKHGNGGPCQIRDRPCSRHLSIVSPGPYRLRNESLHRITDTPDLPPFVGYRPAIR
jgi:hypothetical protein